MPFIESDDERFSPSGWRLLLGILLAPVVPSFCFAYLFGSEVLGPVLAMGALSVMVAYLPLVAWRLPSTERPMLTCVALGALAAPGPLGVTALSVVSVAGGGAAIPLAALILIFTMPLGALGGFVFWLCVVWRSREFAAARAARLAMRSG